MKFFRRFIRKVIKPFRRKIKKIFKLYGKQIFTAYLVGVLPFGYTTTSLVTNANFLNPTSVIQTLFSGGIPNVITGGISEPISLKFNEWKAGIASTLSGGTQEAQAQLQQAKDKAEAYFSATSESVASTIGAVTATQNVNLDNVNLVDGTMVALPRWNVEQFPDYYTVLGQANVDVSQFPEKGGIIYSAIDELGRTQTATGTLTRKNYVDSLGVRQEFKAGSEPSGWYYPNTRTANQVKVSVDLGNGKVYNGFAYNRSHLIGDAIGGEAIKENAITGTRTQNVGTGDGGMRYTEKKVENYFKEGHENNVVYYRNQPIYIGDNIVPMGNVIWVQSDDGVLNEKVYVFNSMNGFGIDRSTGALGKM